MPFFSVILFKFFAGSTPSLLNSFLLKKLRKEPSFDATSKIDILFLIFFFLFNNKYFSLKLLSIFEMF